MSDLDYFGYRLLAIPFRRSNLKSTLRSHHTKQNRLMQHEHSQRSARIGTLWYSEAGRVRIGSFPSPRSAMSCRGPSGSYPEQSPPTDIALPDPQRKNSHEYRLAACRFSVEDLVAGRPGFHCMRQCLINHPKWRPQSRLQAQPVKERRHHIFAQLQCADGFQRHRRLCFLQGCIPEHRPSPPDRSDT